MMTSNITASIEDQSQFVVRFDGHGGGDDDDDDDDDHDDDHDDDDDDDDDSMPKVIAGRYGF